MGRGFRLLRLARLRERPLYQCRHTYATLLLSEGLNPLYVAHQMGHSTVAMVVRHYARWTHKPDGSDAERVKRSLAAGLVPPKMPEIARKRWIQTLAAGILIGRKPAELLTKLQRGEVAEWSKAPDC